MGAQCGRLYSLAKADKLSFFAIDESKLSEAVEATERCIRERYPSLKVPPHSRIRHFDSNLVPQLLRDWQCDTVEKTRRLVDLIFVSVLSDAGAGATWQYTTVSGDVLKASEGLAQAAVDLFLDGFFSTDSAMPSRVNSAALKQVTEEKLSRGFQVSRVNPLVGVGGRAKLMRELGEALEMHPEFFGKEVPRPGNLVDYLLSKATGNEVTLEHLWRVCIEGLYSMWPLQPNGLLRGDIWTHSQLHMDGKPGSDLVPFHKLTQWLVYSMMDALDLSLGLKVTNTEVMTGLPEYRNGGLLVDTGVLSLKDPSWTAQEVNAGSELIVEWRALTVVLIDEIANRLRKRLGTTAEELPLACVLEGGTWHAGRELAQSLRATGNPPIQIRLDGTVV